MRVSDRFFPKQNPKSGGSIYIWTLGANRSAHHVASKFGTKKQWAFRWIEVQLTYDCQRMFAGRRAGVNALLENHPELRQVLSETDRRHISNAAGRQHTDAVRLMLKCGWPVAWMGAKDRRRCIGRSGTEIRRCARNPRHNPPPEVSNAATFGAPPMGWEVHGSEHGWHCKTGDYAGTIGSLLAAGAKRPKTIEGSEAARAELARNAQP
jgi:hypothetical protein